YPSSDPVFVLDVTGRTENLTNVYIHDLQITQPILPGPIRSNAYGIKFVWSGGLDLTALRLERLVIENMSNDGIHLDGSTRGITGVSIRQVLSTENAGHGVWINYSTLLNVVDCYFSRNQYSGATILACPGARVLWSAIEDNWRGTPNPSGGTVGHLTVANSDAFQVNGCHFEEWDDRNGNPQDPLAMTALYVYGPTQGGSITNNLFINDNLTANSRAVFLGYTASIAGVLIGSNEFHE